MPNAAPTQLNRPRALPAVTSSQQTFDFWDAEREVKGERAERTGKTEAPCFPESPCFVEKPGVPSRSELVASLQRQASSMVSRPVRQTNDVFSSGCRELDLCLPAGGLERSALCEWTTRQPGSASGTLALIAAAHALRQHPGPLVIVDSLGTFYPPAATSLGIPASRLLWCRPQNRRDTVWTLDQSLRCPAVAAVWGALPWNLDDRDARRLQLAAEQGPTPGLIVRPASRQPQPSFAAVRWSVTPVRLQSAVSPNTMSDRHVRIRLERAVAGHAFQATDASMLLSITDRATLHVIPSVPRDRHAATPVPLASQLAHPTSKRRQINRAG
ncbi:MAG: hypothetical protein AAGD07_21915 [Planctomycetota bacterium]